MKVIATASQKGGVGKTTLVLNLGYAMARMGWRTVVVDCDPQGAIGHSLTRKVAKSAGLFEVFNGQCEVSDAVIETRLKELSLLPVGKVDVRQVSWFRGQLSLGNLTHTLSELAGYDVVLLDTPGSMGPSTLGILQVSDYVLAPVQAEPIAVRTIPQLLEALGWLRESGSTLRILGFVLTMVAANDPSSEAVVAEYQRLFPSHVTFRTRIPRDPIFLKASAAGVPVGLLSRKPPPAAKLFSALAEEIETRIDIGILDEGPISLVD